MSLEYDKQMRPRKTEKYAILETAVDFENLKYVLVIKE